MPIGQLQASCSSILIAPSSKNFAVSLSLTPRAIFSDLSPYRLTFYTINSNLSSPLDHDELIGLKLSMDDVIETCEESIDAHVIEPSIIYTPNHLFNSFGMDAIDASNDLVPLLNLETLDVFAFFDSSSTGSFIKLIHAQTIALVAK